jgi:A/G-specific adenine glycosylase
MKRVSGRQAPAADQAAHDFADPTFSEAVIRWQKQHGRHALPWQNTRDAYRIWLSEIMLQQTQVAAVIPYYQRFLLRFPNVASLAAAPSEEVMAHWSVLARAQSASMRAADCRAP